MRKLTEAEKKLFEEAKDKELDSGISAEAVAPAPKKGIPLSRLMKMRWVLTWKEAPEDAAD